MCLRACRGQRQKAINRKSGKGPGLTREIDGDHETKTTNLQLRVLRISIKLARQARLESTTRRTAAEHKSIMCPVSGERAFKDMRTRGRRIGELGRDEDQDEWSSLGRHRIEGNPNSKKQVVSFQRRIRQCIGHRKKMHGVDVGVSDDPDMQQAYLLHYMNSGSLGHGKRELTFDMLCAPCLGFFKAIISQREYLYMVVLVVTHRAEGRGRNESLESMLRLLFKFRRPHDLGRRGRGPNAFIERGTSCRVLFIDESLDVERK
ncbi:hypothetical protein ARMGADRAFT_1029355 [Armillaria gallica]|uniref:Uncharacterized protein n=1 Tax=Armillaria gallica TaxID=47427 RepID=A0A2H3DG53_ARMGA|nr:hypothetical protein ARMGADRAFT_1029355 [Armillaria gallica]